MTIVFVVTSIILAVVLGYSLMVLKTLREELKQKNQLLRLYKTYNGEVKLP
jgi:hypothetical protein